MDVQGLQMTQNQPAPGVFKRNPPIVGEAEAIEAAKNGDAEAFSKLYALHKRRVYTLCLRMLGNVSEAEDMTQEAFLHLFRKIGSFRGESAFSTWLHRLTVNLVLMHLRKKGLNLVSLEETINPSEEDAPKRDFGSRDLQLTGSVDRVALERAVASLPPATAWSSSSTTSKASSTTKSLPCSSAPPATASPNFTKPASSSANSSATRNGPPSPPASTRWPYEQQRLSRLRHHDSCRF